MSTTQLETAPARTLPSLELNAEQTYGDWRDDFFKNGYHIFKGVISADKATNYYQKKALEWITSFNMGLDLNDRSTWTKDHLPQNFKNMYMNYCAAHEKYMWDARTEPNLIRPFEQLWGTNELLASFDTVNITLPGRKDSDFRPWPHVDQAPERKGMACVQGFLNLSPAGPKDGGLLLMPGSAPLFEEFFASNKARDRVNAESKHYDFYMFQDDELEWFRARGCSQTKICLEPGDMIMWDSRTIHHVALPESDTIRTVIYTCFTPRALAKQEDIDFKVELFKRWEATTHWPHCNIYGHGKAMIDGKVDPLERDEPLEKPVMTDQIWKLVGAKPY